MFTRFWFAMTLVFAAHASADRLPDGISLVGNTAHKPIAEMSGIARYAGHIATSPIAWNQVPVRHATTVFTSGISMISSDSVWKPIV